MKKADAELFKLVEKKTYAMWEKRFAKYYINDSKPFINKLSRDHEKTRKFPINF